MTRFNSFSNMWLAAGLVLVHILWQVTADEICTDGSRCISPNYCCEYTTGCCSGGGGGGTYYYSTWSIWNMWYFWFIIIFILLSCFGGCGYWRRRQWAISQQRRQQAAVASVNAPHGTAATTLSPPAMYAYDFGPQHMYTPPPNAQAAAFQSPPAYNEVVSKPDIYPPNKNDCPPYPGFVAAEGAMPMMYPPTANPVHPPAYTMMSAPVPAPAGAIATVAPPTTDPSTQSAPNIPPQPQPTQPQLPTTQQS